MPTPTTPTPDPSPADPAPSHRRPGSRPRPVHAAIPLAKGRLVPGGGKPDGEGMRLRTASMRGPSMLITGPASRCVLEAGLTADGGLVIPRGHGTPLRERPGQAKCTDHGGCERSGHVAVVLSAANMLFN
ncbi:hypothetical protein Arub01_48460 [Actinomadura rubrobrunea]|uniref:Uncharacterized protein n=1 Tax=Actinomadura rubrobrunea TaxID=115335 RepID=A0A9W6UYU0_9ACTN|nr:hypothetical protein Arub01_48460 [Actinomadura rubrobrunea]